MKLLIVLFFTLSFPFVIFLTTILYSPDITPILKTDLAQHHIYTQLSSQLGKLNSGDSNNAAISAFIQNKFTSDYIQQKIETAMASSDNWIRGKSSTPPVVSFKDVKNDLNAQYPQLLPAIENAAAEMKEKESQQNGMTSAQQAQADKSINMLTYLAKSDFTIPLNKYLAGLKDFYTTVRILQPILAILLIACLILLCTLNNSWRQRLTWIGIALLFSSILGFGLAYGDIFVVKLLTTLTTKNTNHVIQLASPIVLQIIKQYVNAYANYQKITSLVLLITAGGCFIAEVFIRNTPVAIVKHKKLKRKR